MSSEIKLQERRSTELRTIRKLQVLSFLGLHAQESLFALYRPLWTGNVCEKEVQTKPVKTAFGEFFRSDSLALSQSIKYQVK